MARIESAARELQERAALWSVGKVRAGDVVRAAGAALVAGLNGPAGSVSSVSRPASSQV